MESLRHLFPFKGYFHFRFPLPVSWLTFDLPMSDNVNSVIFWSGMVENVGVAVGIASPSVSDVSVQKLFPLPVSTSGFVADICVSDVGRCRAVSAVPYLRRAWSKMWV